MGTLFFSRLQKEGVLQKGDEVLVNGRPGRVFGIVSTREVVIDLDNGTRLALKDIELPACRLTGEVP